MRPLTGRLLRFLLAAASAILSQPSLVARYLRASTSGTSASPISTGEQRDNAERAFMWVSAVKSLLTKTTCRLPASAASFAKSCRVLRKPGFACRSFCAFVNDQRHGAPVLVAAATEGRARQGNTAAAHR